MEQRIHCWVPEGCGEWTLRRAGERIGGGESPAPHYLIWNFKAPLRGSMVGPSTWEVDFHEGWGRMILLLKAGRKFRVSESFSQCSLMRLTRFQKTKTLVPISPSKQHTCTSKCEEGQRDLGREHRLQLWADEHSNPVPSFPNFFIFILDGSLLALVPSLPVKLRW